jgi:hypothetical protein
MRMSQREVTSAAAAIMPHDVTTTRGCAGPSSSDDLVSTKRCRDATALVGAGEVINAPRGGVARVA